MSPTVRVDEFSTLVSNLVDQLTLRLAPTAHQNASSSGSSGHPVRGSRRSPQTWKADSRRPASSPGSSPWTASTCPTPSWTTWGAATARAPRTLSTSRATWQPLDRVRADGAPQVFVPVYRRDLHESVSAGGVVSGTGVVVTEGNYLALETRGWGAVRERIDLLIHIDVPEEVLVVRLINRHEDFGKNALDAGHWVRTVDLPNARLIATSVHRCDEVWRNPKDEPDSDDAK